MGESSSLRSAEEEEEDKVGTKRVSKQGVSNKGVSISRDFFKKFPMSSAFTSQFYCSMSADLF